MFELSTRHIDAVFRAFHGEPPSPDMAEAVSIWKSRFVWARTRDDFVERNRIKEVVGKYELDKPCSYELWDRESKALRQCGGTPTRCVKGKPGGENAKYVCERHDTLWL